MISLYPLPFSSLIFTLLEYLFLQIILSFFLEPTQFLILISIDAIESSWNKIFIANPFYHLVSNIRKTFEADQSYNFQLDVLLIILLFFLIYITLFIYKKGYRVIY